MPSATLAPKKGLFPNVSQIRQMKMGEIDKFCHISDARTRLINKWHKKERKTPAAKQMTRLRLLGSLRRRSRMSRSVDTTRQDTPS